MLLHVRFNRQNACITLYEINFLDFIYFNSKNSFNLQILDEKKLDQVDNLYLEFETPEKANKM